jgi:hypothetical protein
MEPPEVLRIHPVPHRLAEVRQVGFPLDDPYVEQVWSCFTGPSATLMLRRMPVLWSHDQPATVQLSEFGRSLGLLRPTITYRSVDRLARFGLARWLPSGDLAVATRVAPLSARQLDRVPSWTRQAHDQLLGAHLDRLAASPTPTDRDLTRINARLDQLEHRHATPHRGLSR